MATLKSNLKSSTKSAPVSNETEANTIIGNFLNAVKGQGQAELKLVDYMFKDEANYASHFLAAYRKSINAGGTKRTEFLDSKLMLMSADYEELYRAWAKSKEGKKPTKQEKLAQKGRSDRLNAARMMFKRALASLAYLRHIKPTEFTLNDDGALVRWNDAGKALMDIVSGRQLTTLGTNLLPKGESNRTGTGGKGAVDKSSGASIKGSAENITKLLNTAKPDALSDIIATDHAKNLLKTLIVKNFVHDGEVKTIEVKQWIEDNLPGIRIDGKVKEVTAKEAEGMTKPNGAKAAQQNSAKK